MSRASSNTTGNDGCPCIDTSDVLESIAERSCQTTGGQNGVLLTVEGACVPPSYGSSYCRQHDLLHDPDCQLGEGNIIPDYCVRPWCYVDAKSCTKSSSERIYRSTHFDRETGLDLFYSYTACDPNYDDWARVQPTHTLGGTTLTAAIPMNFPPFMYKREDAPDSNSSITSYEGVLINYMASLVEIADGDFDISYTPVTNASKRVHPRSSFTAAVQDIEDGLVDLGVGPFWVTGERLQMTAYTVPLYYDRTMLVIKNPGKESSLSAEIQKVLDPFQMGVWVLIICLILFTALLSVWFSDRPKLARRYSSGPTVRAKQSNHLRKSVYVRLALDEFLKNGIFFCSAGAEQDSGASLPQKLLVFGFSFFVLIVVSAYVANLAAFLTRDMNSYVGSMEDSVARGVPICAYSTLQAALRVSWPTANFVFSETASDWVGVLEDYDAGKCKVMAIPHTKMSPNTKLMAGMCERDLVFTQSLVIENPVSLPVRPELVNGLSYWMYEAEKMHDVTLLTALEEHYALNGDESICDLDFSVQQQDEGEYAKISVKNLIFPIIFFVSFAALAILIQLFHRRALKKGATRSLAGRSSALNIMLGVASRKSLAKYDSEPRLPVSKNDKGTSEERGSKASNSGKSVSFRRTTDALSESSELDVETVKGLDLSDTIEGKDESDRVQIHGLGVQDASPREQFQHCLDEYDSSASHLSSGRDNATEATHRLQEIVETGVFDEIVACVEEIKRQKES